MTLTISLDSVLSKLRACGISKNRNVPRSFSATHRDGGEPDLWAEPSVCAGS
jgi:hypothetical protein